MSEVLEIKLSGDGRITSVELCELINMFRIEEGNETKLLHKNLLESIRTEVEVLEKAGIFSGLNFQPTYYDDLQGKHRPCFSLSDNGVLEMLNKESAVVRYKTVEYIKKLKDKLGKRDSYMINDPIERAKRWIEEQEERILLEQKNDTLSKENDLLSQKTLQWADRALINAIVRAYGHGIGDDYQTAWKEFKKEALYQYGINLNSRITSYLNSTGKKTKPKTLNMLTDEELPQALSTAVALCREHSIDISDIIQKKAS